MSNKLKGSTKLIGMAILVSSVAATVAFADDMGKRGGHMMRPSFEEIDANADGFVTLEEMQAMKDAKFAEIDTDGNGELSLEEMQAKHGDRAGDDNGRHARMFAAMDADGSGGLTQEEMHPGADKSAVHFAGADADGDGQLSQEEFEAGHGKMGRGHHGEGKHGKRGGHGADDAQAAAETESANN